MKIKIHRDKNIVIIISFFLLTLAGSAFFQDNGLTKITEYLSLGLLMYSIASNWKQQGKKDRLFFLCVLCLLEVGIVVQSGNVRDKLSVIFSMVIIWLLFCKSKGVFQSFKVFRDISYTVLVAIVVSTFLSLFSGYSLFDTLTENNFEWGFNGGILYKNYFAADMIVVLSGLIVYRKYEKKYQIDLFVEIISFFFLLLSFSKGAWLIMLSFVIAMNWKYFGRVKKRQRNILLFILLALGACIFVFLFQNYAMKTTTFMYRINGWENYIRYLNGDMKLLFWGNATKFLHGNSSYVYDFRSVVGWDGTLEIAWLNVLIKNGIVGMIGFIIMFIYYFMGLFKRRAVNQELYLACLIMLLISSFVEIYMQSLHHPFAIYCYLTLGGFLCNKDDEKNRSFRGYNDELNKCNSKCL